MKMSLKLLVLDERIQVLIHVLEHQEELLVFPDHLNELDNVLVLQNLQSLAHKRKSNKVTKKENKKKEKEP